ncbi:MAG: hypothetical protein Q9184_002244 [Pyrenodesmia sp. 2 TL-2023]
MDSVATGTVHRALHALLASTQILDDLFKRFPSSPLQLNLAEVDKPLASQLLVQLNATFTDFENLLFKAVDGAGPAVCVAIGIVFITTLILRKIAQEFGLPVLIETGVENMLQALFGLLSVTYRNTGILNVLQEYSGRELGPYSGEPSPDIIEALHDLLACRDSLPARTATTVSQTTSVASKEEAYSGQLNPSK